MHGLPLRFSTICIVDVVPLSEDEVIRQFHNSSERGAPTTIRLYIYIFSHSIVFKSVPGLLGRNTSAVMGDKKRTLVRMFAKARCNSSAFTSWCDFFPSTLAAPTVPAAPRSLPSSRGADSAAAPVSTSDCIIDTCCRSLRGSAFGNFLLTGRGGGLFSRDGGANGPLLLCDNVSSGLFVTRLLKLPRLRVLRCLCSRAT